MTDYQLDIEDVGLPRGEAETWHEAAERLRDGRDRLHPKAREIYG